MKWLILILIIFKSSNLLANDPSIILGDTSPDEWQDQYKVVPEKGYKIQGASVAWANFSLLRQEFPYLAHLSNEEIIQWILDEFAYLSESQLHLYGLRYLDVNLDYEQQKDMFKHGSYGRAAILRSSKGGMIETKGSGSSNMSNSLYRQILNTLEKFDDVSKLKSFLDSLSIRDHSDGLMSFGEAIAELTRQQAAQKLMEINGSHSPQSQMQTNESLFIIHMPGTLLRNKENASLAIYGRQSHPYRSGKMGYESFLSIFKDEHGGGQTTVSRSLIDFGGVEIVDGRLNHNFNGLNGGSFKNAQESKPWSWGHEVAKSYIDGDIGSVYRHLNEMIGPISHEWNQLEIAKKHREYEKPVPFKMDNTNNKENLVAQILERINSTEDPRIWYWSFKTLAEVKYENLIELVEKYHNHENPQIRESVLKSLQIYWNPKAIGIIEKLILDSSPNVSKVAMEIWYNEKIQSNMLIEILPILVDKSISGYKENLEKIIELSTLLNEQEKMKFFYQCKNKLGENYFYCLKIFKSEYNEEIKKIIEQALESGSDKPLNKYRALEYLSYIDNDWALDIAEKYIESEDSITVNLSIKALKNKSNDRWKRILFNYIGYPDNLKVRSLPVLEIVSVLEDIEEDFVYDIYKHLIKNAGYAGAVSTLFQDLLLRNNESSLKLIESLFEKGSGTPLSILELLVRNIYKNNSQAFNRNLILKIINHPNNEIKNLGLYLMAKSSNEDEFELIESLFKLSINSELTGIIELVKTRSKSKDIISNLIKSIKNKDIKNMERVLSELEIFPQIKNFLLLTAFQHLDKEDVNWGLSELKKYKSSFNCLDALQVILN